jgi:hypothetical protein
MRITTVSMRPERSEGFFGHRLKPVGDTPIASTKFPPGWN